MSDHKNEIITHVYCRKRSCIGKLFILILVHGLNIATGSVFDQCVVRTMLYICSLF